MTDFPFLFVAAVSVIEIVLLGLVVFFFWRLKKSEALLSALQQKQSELLKRLHFNTELEQELVTSFAKRQDELSILDDKLSERVDELKRLLKRAEEVGRSPRLLREIVITGGREGRSPLELAQTTGLSIDEVELILEQAETG